MSILVSTIKHQINNLMLDIREFINVIIGKAKPKKVHLIELYTDHEVVQWITEDILNKQWVPLPSEISNRERFQKHLLCQMEYSFRMGYGFVRGVGGVDFVNNSMVTQEPCYKMGRQERSWANMHNGPIKNWRNFEQYP